MGSSARARPVSQAATVASSPLAVRFAMTSWTSAVEEVVGEVGERDPGVEVDGVHTDLAASQPRDLIGRDVTSLRGDDGACPLGGGELREVIGQRGG